MTKHPSEARAIRDATTFVWLEPPDQSIMLCLTTLINDESASRETIHRPIDGQNLGLCGNAILVRCG